MVGSTFPDAATIRAALIAREPDAARRPATIRIVRAPGRVNLIGEHTDYNDGLVLPAAIGLKLRIAYVPTDDRRVELTLLATGERAGFDLDSIPGRRGSWIDYVAGTAVALDRAGMPTIGFRGVLASDLPASAGLSSSAALELAAAWALAGDQPPLLGGLALAQVAQRGENDYVGVRCGLMDQFASANGQPGHALLLDCRSLAWDPVPIPADVRMVVCSTGSMRKLEASEYNSRREDCDQVVAAVAEQEPRVRSLRDVDAALLDRYRHRLDPVGLRRAQHVVAENDRVLETKEALEGRDFEAIGRLFAASHASLRDLYEVSSPELDAMVEIASTTPGVIGARMTGAGFGGCTISLVRPEAVGPLREAVERDYTRLTGRSARVWEVDAVAGAGEIVTP